MYELQYYLLDDVRSKYSPSFFHLTTGCGYPLGGAHLRIVSSPTETSVSFGRILKSSLMSATYKRRENITTICGVEVSIQLALTDLWPEHNNVCKSYFVALFAFCQNPAKNQFSDDFIFTEMTVNFFQRAKNSFRQVLKIERRCIFRCSVLKHQFEYLIENYHFLSSSLFNSV